MKANELRIGNWYDHNGIPMQVTPNTIEEVWTAERIWCKPIPLTEEWMLKFGFVEKNIGKKLPQSLYELKYLSNEHNPIITSWVSILINVETWSCVICDEYPDEIGANTKIKIKHVHQLQNLYFALTGEELTVNEKP